jgi:two-component system, NarL family, sensor histidine kinase DegS
MKKLMNNPAIRISLIYAIFSMLWIYLSDHVLAVLIPNPKLLVDLSSVKGFGFVAVTAVLLYYERMSSERSRRRAETALRKAEQKYRVIFETAPIGIFQVAQDGKYMDANAVFSGMLGYDTPRELIENFVDQQQNSPANSSSAPPKAGANHLKHERQYRRKDGGLVDAIVDVRVINDEDGRAPYLEGFAEDITDRKAAEQKIQQMADIVQSSQDAIFSVALNGAITSWNPAAALIYGYLPAEIEGKSAVKLIPLGHTDALAYFRRIISFGESVREYELIQRRKDGALLNLSVAASPIRDLSGHIHGISVIARDITERKQIMQRLEEQQHALREYAHRLIVSQEDERKRLSRELHDETLQDLVALAQRAELARIALDRDPAIATRRLEDLQGLAKDMIVKLRRISNDLRPLILEDLGIAAAVQFLSDELARQMPYCDVHCEIDGDEKRLDPDVEITTFRIVQQALNNVRMHAPTTTRVDVRLVFEVHDIRACVQDNGPGFVMLDIEELVRQGHLGLAGMQERASLLNGQVNVASIPQSGTTVTLRLPYVQEERLGA